MRKAPRECGALAISGQLPTPNLRIASEYPVIPPRKITSATKQGKNKFSKRDTGFLRGIRLPEIAGGKGDAHLRGKNARRSMAVAGKQAIRPRSHGDQPTEQKTAEGAAAGCGRVAVAGCGGGLRRRVAGGCGGGLRAGCGGGLRAGCAQPFVTAAYGRWRAARSLSAACRPPGYRNVPSCVRR
jgi:hypothetical protein